MSQVLNGFKVSFEQCSTAINGLVHKAQLVGQIGGSRTDSFESACNEACNEVSGQQVALTSERCQAQNNSSLGKITMFSKPNLRSNLVTLIGIIFLILAINFDNVGLAVARLVYLERFSSSCNMSSESEFTPISDIEGMKLMHGIPLKFSHIVFGAYSPEDRALRSACVTELLGKSKDYPVKINGYYQSDIHVETLPVFGQLLWVGALCGLAIVIMRFIVSRVFSVSPVLGRLTLVLGVLAVAAQVIGFDNPLPQTVRGNALFMAMVITAGEMCLLALVLLTGRWVLNGLNNEKG